jgi:hypothetical protein
MPGQAADAHQPSWRPAATPARRAQTSHLSKKGCRVHTDHEPPPAGAALTLEARLGARATHLRIPGTVRWTRPNPRGGFVFGLSFDGIGPEEQRALDAVIDEFRRRAAALE